MSEQSTAEPPPELAVVTTPGPGRDELASLVALSRDVLVLLDPSALTLAVSPSCLPLTGYTVEDLVGRSALDVVHPEDRASVQQTISRLLTLRRPQSLRFRVVRRDATAAWVQAYATPPEGSDPTFGVILHDVTERMEFEQLMQHAALHDPVTGLANRRMLDDALAAAVARAERSRRPVAVIFTDLDHFKQLNDTYGHASGDHVLRVVAERLEHATRTGDLVARFGGDEFVTLVLDASVDQLDNQVARVRAAVAQPISSARQVHQVSASVGVAVWRPGMTPEGLLVAADEAMYTDKRR